jgi:predicted dehydrogenase
MIRLGILGQSVGNGHPYSWSAICNGYDRAKMEQCEFPVIPRYLELQDWPDARLPQVEVTHVWTQDQHLSRQIAEASLIQNVVEEPSQMIGHVDAVLLARDDAENHIELATPFLRAGLPIYIDKPVALSIFEFNRLHQLEVYDGQIFSCSAMGYAKELELPDWLMGHEDRIRHIEATTPKYWKTYAVHCIDPVVGIIGKDKSVKKHFGSNYGFGGTKLGVTWDTGQTTTFTAFGNLRSDIVISLYGDDFVHELKFYDSFSAFKAAIAEFLLGVKEGASKRPADYNRRVVEIIEMGIGE